VTTEQANEEIIHHWTGTAEPSACGVNVVSTPYTYGSPEWNDVTCTDCLTKAPTPKKYHYMVRYVIVAPLGDLLWGGYCDIFQDKPRPTDEGEIAKLDALLTAKTIRKSCDENPRCPQGKVIVTAVYPI
jgi:hypothetical protein